MKTNARTRPSADGAPTDGPAIEHLLRRCNTALVFTEAEPRP